jgi:hypothetical protein
MEENNQISQKNTHLDSVHLMNRSTLGKEETKKISFSYTTKKGKTKIPQL